MAKEIPNHRATSTSKGIKPSILEYPEGTLPKLSNECARLKLTNNQFKFWIERAHSFHKEMMFPEALAAEAVAYTRHDKEAFLRFAIEILGFKDVSPAFHGQMIPYITGLVPGRQKNQIIAPYRMELAFRGSLKSTLSSIALPTWRIAQSTVNHDWENCTARIALASEKIALAKQHVGACRNVISSLPYKTRFGDHKPKKRDEGSWGNEMFTSRLQTSLYTKDPTVFTMSLSVDRTGFHCTSIVGDDLQARSSTYNIEQIEKAWELYRLLHSILDPETTDEFIEMLLSGTTWHFDDVYARIEQESKKAEDDDARKHQLKGPLFDPAVTPRFYIQKIPSESDVSRAPGDYDLEKWISTRDVEGTNLKEVVVRTASWPGRFPLVKLDQIKAHQGNEIYNAQYLLDPIPTADRTFLRKDLRYRDTASDERLFSNNYFVLIGGDPAWMSQESVRQREGTSTANSVLVAVAIDPAYNLHILSIFRQKAAIPEFSEELWQMYFGKYKNVISCALQSYDYKYLAPEFKRKFVETKKMPNIKWVSAGGGREDRPDKNDRIRARLSGLWSSHKILLPRGHPEVEAEFFDFPKGKRKDFLDALSNIVEIMSAPNVSEADEARKVQSTSIIDSVESGMPLGVPDLSWKNGY